MEKGDPMADLAMCQNKECPKRAECYRYRAIPNEKWQSYQDFNHGVDGCEYFWEVGNRTNVLSLEEIEDQ